MLGAGCLVCKPLSFVDGDWGGGECLNVMLVSKCAGVEELYTSCFVGFWNDATCVRNLFGSKRMQYFIPVWLL